MSCLSAIGTQIFTYILVPHEIILFKHKVFKEYAKVAFGPDFSHTFPSFIVIMAVFVILRRSLNLNWLRIPANKSFLRASARIFVSWVIINAVLWHWLIIQGVLYCVVWTHWRNDLEILEIYSPWWKSVFSSFPLQSKRPVLSASFVSWLLSMMISAVILFFTIYTNYITSIFKRASQSAGEHFKTIKSYKTSSLKKLREMTPYCDCRDDILSDKSEIYCDECTYCVCGSDTCTEFCDCKIHRESSPMTYSEWVLPPGLRDNKNINNNNK